MGRESSVAQFKLVSSTTLIYKKEKLHVKLEVLNDISNELMLENIEQFIPNTFSPYIISIKDFRSFASTIKKVITKFKQNQERLEERAKELIRDKRHEQSL